MTVIVGGGAVAFPVPGRSGYRELPVPVHLAGVVRALWVITGTLRSLSDRLAHAGGRLPDGAAIAQAACRLIEREAEALSIRSVADRLGVPERTLRDVFAVQFGLSPKALHGVRRLQKALALAAGRPSLGLAPLADRAGYSDQAT